MLMYPPQQIESVLGPDWRSQLAEWIVPLPHPTHILLRLDNPLLWKNCERRPVAPPRPAPSPEPSPEICAAQEAAALVCEKCPHSEGVTRFVRAFRVFAVRCRECGTCGLRPLVNGCPLGNFVPISPRTAR